MTITSPLWLAAMVATVAGYWLLGPSLRRGFLVLATAGFLLYADYRAFLLLAMFSVGTWVVMESGFRRSTMLALAVPILILVYYKTQTSIGPLATLEDALIPLGLSYSTFRVLHYVLERSRNNLPEHGFFDYLAYLFFLPTILIGPINRFPQFVADCRSNRWQADHISAGLERILIGYFKVTVIGNYLLSGLAPTWVEAASEYNLSLGYYLEAARGSLNLYFQFSGYSDVAIGMALMMGYKIMENFNFPFLQKNMSEFWRCWHISLTSWSREYIFMPVLSLSRKPYFATLVSLLFIGLWHEISPRYLVWGIYHGIGIVICMQWGKYKKKLGLPAPESALAVFVVDGLKIFLTANYFILGYNITTQGSLLDSARVMGITLMPWAY